MAANIIKARDAGLDSAFRRPGVLKRDLYAAGVTAAAIIRSAEQRAETLVEQANGKRKEVFDKASRDGYDDGLSKWNEILVQAWAGREQFFQNNEADIVRLSVKLAERVLGEQLRLEPATVLAVIREAMSSVRRERNLVVHVCAQDLELVRKRADELQPLLLGGRDIDIRPNPKVKPGGCIIESELGVIDARIETQFERLEKALLRTQS